jgi:hypothetical protein
MINKEIDQFRAFQKFKSRRVKYKRTGAFAGIRRLVHDTAGCAQPRQTRRKNQTNWTRPDYQNIRVHRSSAALPDRRLIWFFSDWNSIAQNFPERVFLICIGRLPGAAGAEASVPRRCCQDNFADMIARFHARMSF